MADETEALLGRTESRTESERGITGQDSLSPTPTVWQISKGFKGKVKVVAAMFCFFVAGMFGTAVGALLVELESWYHIKDTTAAFIFLFSMLGYLGGTILLSMMLDRYGWRGIALSSPLLQLVASMGLSTAPPFPVLLACYFCMGLGTGLSDAGFCAWASKLSYTNIVQGMMHGSFSVGSILGPIVCASVLGGKRDWYEFYVLMTIAACLNTILLVFAFASENVEVYQASHKTTTTDIVRTTTRPRVIALCGFFFFFYIGIEASFTNWIPAYMTRIRGVDTSRASLASSVFWVGMSIGRFALGIVTEYYGLSVSVAVYIILATLLQVIFRYWQAYGPSLMLLSLIGFFFAPTFPSGIITISRKLSMQEYVAGVTAVVAIGQVGGAGSQLLIAVMADKLGLEHLINIVLFLSVVLLATWIRFTRAR